jgi:hypothetical protein
MEIDMERLRRIVGSSQECDRGQHNRESRMSGRATLIESHYPGQNYLLDALPAADSAWWLDCLLLSHQGV